jgi:hypothetical protein
LNGWYHIRILSEAGAIDVVEVEIFQFSARGLLAFRACMVYRGTVRRCRNKAMILGIVTSRQQSGGKGGLDKTSRLMRGLLFGILVTCAGWALLIVVSGLLDEGGAHEHDPGTITEIVLNTLCNVALLPMFIAALFVRDGQGIFSYVAVPLVFALNVGFWGCLSELSRAGIAALKRKLGTQAPKV